MTEREAYRRFLEGLRLRHFRTQEVIGYADRRVGGQSNSLPPRRLWGNIVPTLVLLDQLREFLGRPIRLTSIYRSAAYNAAVGATPGSQHRKNAAIDFQVDGVSPRAVYERLLRYRQAGVFRGGLGKYPTFTHLDTRGFNATWGRH